MNVPSNKATLSRQNILRYRDAIVNVALLSLRLRYSNSLLGFLWGLANPLFFTLIFSFVFSVLLKSGVPNFPVFVLAAMMPWNFFQTALSGAIVSVSSGRGLITKIVFPREILPLSYILSELTNFAMALIAILIILALIGQWPGQAVLALPVLCLVLAIFTAGIGMLLATLNVWLRDTQEFMNVFLLGWFFLTPVVYPIAQIDASLTILGIPARVFVETVNPVASIVLSFRAVMYEHQWPDGGTFAWAIIVSLVTFVIGLVVFQRNSHRFAERV